MRKHLLERYEELHGKEDRYNSRCAVGGKAHKGTFIFHIGTFILERLYFILKRL